MLFSIIQDGISEVTQLYLKGKLKKWWNYHRIDRNIARQIRDTCEDEGVDFDEFLIRLGISKSTVNRRLKELKRSFKGKKTYIGVEEFVLDIADNYFDIFLKVEVSVVKDNPLDEGELNLLKKIKRNVQIYLTNFKPVETIANININLNELEAKNKDQYLNLMAKLEKITSVNELIPENLNNLRQEIEDNLKVLQREHSEIYEEVIDVKKEVKEGFSREGKIARSISYSELFDIKLGFVEAMISENNKINVGSTYKINIYIDSKVPLQITKVGVNQEPISAVIFGKVLNNLPLE